MPDQPVSFDPQPEPQPAEDMQPPAGQPAETPQVPAGVQESPAVGVPRRTQDVEGNPVNELLDPETGAPKE